MVVNNIHDNPITIGGDALLWLLHHQVAAWVEADSAPSGALDLDMGAIQVSRVDEGAGREYLKRCYWMKAHLPPMKGTKGFGFPTSRHWGRARQITSGLGIGRSCLKGNPTLRGGGHNLGKAARSTAKSSSWLLQKVFTLE